MVRPLEENKCSKGVTQQTTKTQSSQRHNVDMPTWQQNIKYYMQKVNVEAQTKNHDHCSMSQKQSHEYDQQQHFKVIPTPTLDDFVEGSLDDFHPFTLEIMSVTLFHKLMCPNIEKYDDSLNTGLQLKGYMTQENFSTNNYTIN